MFLPLTFQVWLALVAIPDRAFQKALMRPEFSRVGQNGHREVNLFWIFPWAWSDDSGNPRYSATARAIREAWSAHSWFNKEHFLPEARRQRYL
jgi:hypothetical protein